MGGNLFSNTVEARNFYSETEPAHPGNNPTALSIFTISYSGKLTNIKA